MLACPLRRQRQRGQRARCGEDEADNHCGRVGLGGGHGGGDNGGGAVEVEFGGGLGGGHGGGDNGGGAAEVEFILVRAASLVIHIIQHTSRLQQPSMGICSSSL